MLIHFRLLKRVYKNNVKMYTKTANINVTKNSSGDEIANVNFLYDEIIHVLQNTIHSRINSVTDRRGYVL